MLSEAQGCAALQRTFERRGYMVARNVAFSEDGVAFQADGWDAAQRVGFEFVTTAAGDRQEFTPAVMERLEKWTREGRLYFFLVDETDVDTEEDLVWAAQRFLDEVEKRRGSPSRPQP